LRRRIFGEFWLGTFQCFLGNLNESKSLLNPILRDVKRGPVLKVLIDRNAASDEGIKNDNMLDSELSGGA
jgi:hypothetical protein